MWRILNSVISRKDKKRGGKKNSESHLVRWPVLCCPPHNKRPVFSYKLVIEIVRWNHVRAFFYNGLWLVTLFIQACRITTVFMLAMKLSLTSSKQNKNHAKMMTIHDEHRSHKQEEREQLFPGNLIKPVPSAEQTVINDNALSGT